MQLVVGDSTVSDTGAGPMVRQTLELLQKIVNDCPPKEPATIWIDLDGIDQQPTRLWGEAAAAPLLRCLGPVDPQFGMFGHRIRAHVEIVPTRTRPGRRYALRSWGGRRNGKPSNGELARMVRNPLAEPPLPEYEGGRRQLLMSLTDAALVAAPGVPVPQEVALGTLYATACVRYEAVDPTEGVVIFEQVEPMTWTIRLAPDSLPPALVSCMKDIAFFGPDTLVRAEIPFRIVRTPIDEEPGWEPDTFGTLILQRQ